jgi:putative colanic acid biosynthesis acetyltransferase WcaF
VAPRKLTLHSLSARAHGASPWSFQVRLFLFLWEFAWVVLCQWTPKPANRWRLLVLRLFGARIRGRPFVHQRARIQVPWHVELHDAACVGDRANLYSLGLIQIDSGAVIAQETYLCTGTHDFEARELPLLTAPIHVGTRAFVGARAFVMPGVTIGAGAIVGAGSIVTRDVAAGETVWGNPARRAPSR